MVTKNNVFNLIRQNIEVTNETLGVIAECLQTCVEKLTAIEGGATGDTKEIEQALLAQQKETEQTLAEIRALLESLKPKPKKEKAQ